MPKKKSEPAAEIPATKATSRDAAARKPMTSKEGRKLSTLLIYEEQNNDLVAIVEAWKNSPDESKRHMTRADVFETLFGTQLAQAALDAANDVIQAQVAAQQERMIRANRKS